MNRRPTSSARFAGRLGVTLVEVFVTLSALSLLAALALPAVQSARESARKAQCLNNLRQLALAVQEHASGHGDRLPFTSTNGSDQQGRKLLSSSSPHQRLLPFLDQSALYAQLNFQDMSINSPGMPPALADPDQTALLSVRIPVFLCPSDVQRPGATNYRANMGYGPGVYGPDPPAVAGFAGNVAGAFVHGRSTQMSEFQDGTSNTALFSEMLIGAGDPQRYVPWADYFYFRSGDISTADDAVAACNSLSVPNPPHAPYAGWTWFFGGWNSTWYNHILPPNSPVPDCSAGGIEMAGGGPGAYAARSYHRGGVNVAFADGSSRFIGEKLDLSVWRALSTRAGGESMKDLP